MTRPLAWATAMAFLALSSLSVYADDSAVPAPSEVPATGGWVPLPAFVASAEDFYPAAAGRKLLQGSVGLEVQVDAQGRVEILSQTFADHADFASGATQFLKSGHFRVSSDWVQSGGSDQRFVVEVQFSVARAGADCTKRPPRVADTDILVVCRSLPTRKTGRL